jgi:hypothetical protein
LQGIQHVNCKRLFKLRLFESRDDWQKTARDEKKKVPQDDSDQPKFSLDVDEVAEKR